MSIEVVLAGFLVGLIVGISGVGGSALLTPVLILMRINPLVAIGTDLLYSVPTKALAAWVHGRQKSVDWATVISLCIGALPGVSAALVVLQVAKTHLSMATLSSYVKHGVGAALLLSAVALVVGPLLKRNAPAEEDHPAASRTQLALIGAGVGFVVGLTSIGSGSMMLPLLYMVAGRLGIRKLDGTDLAFAAAIVPLAAAGHWSLGHVDVTLAANLALGSLPGVFIGSKFCGILPERWLRPAVAGALVIVGAKLI